MRGAFLVGGHFIKPEMVVVGGDNWTGFRFDNAYSHELGHFAVFSKHGDNVERWFGEGIARCAQEDSMTLLTQKTGQLDYLGYAYDFIIDDLATMYHCLAKMSQTIIPEGLVRVLEPGRDFANLYGVDPLNPEPHLLGTSLMKILQDMNGHDAYKRLFNGDFTELNKFLESA